MSSTSRRSSSGIQTTRFIRSPTPTCWSRSMPNARLVDANSIVEWRLTPERLTNELAGFLDEVYAEGDARGERPARAARG